MHILLVQTACNYHQVVLYSDESGSENIVADWHQDKPRETLSFLMNVLSELEQFTLVRIYSISSLRHA